ncbi:MAG: hypothetical protein ABSF74_03700 [Dehalococcoidia bacterium]|jgi:hypothetical protein
MGGKKRHSAFLALALIGLALIYTGCTGIGQSDLQSQAPPVAPMPIFTFDPILVTPLPVVAGQPFTVTVLVGNTGTVSGTYTADLYINGSKIDTQNIPVPPGASSKAVFQTTVRDPGPITIKIGPQTLQVSVMASRVPISLKLDTGQVDGCDTLVGSTSDAGSVIQSPDAYMIKLTAPAGGVTINALEVFGSIKSSTYDYNNSNIWGPGTWVYGWDIASFEPVNPQFTVNIYDVHKTRLYTGSFPRSMFTYAPAWVTITIPDTRINGDFYVEVLPYNLPKLSSMGFGGWDNWGRYVVHEWYDQICLGYEKVIDVQSWVSYRGGVMPERYITYNWLIRADGYQTQ